MPRLARAPMLMSLLFVWAVAVVVDVGGDDEMEEEDGEGAD